MAEKSTNPPEEAAASDTTVQAPVKTKIVYRRHWGWSIFSVVLAFLLGIVSVFASLAIALGVAKSKDVVALTGLDPNQYIAAEYQDESLLKVVISLVGDAQSGTIASLNGLAKYSPKVSEIVDQLLSEAESFGIRIDKDALCATKFADFAAYLQKTVLPAVELGGVLGLKQGDSNMIITLCYGEEGVDFNYDETGRIVMVNGKTPLTLGDVTSDMEGVIGRLTLGDVLAIDENLPR